MCKYRYKLKPIKGVDTSELYLNYYNGKFELLDISEQFGYITAFEKNDNRIETGNVDLSKFDVIEVG